MSQYWQRAWQDTKSNLGWLETISGGVVTGAMSYGVLSALGSGDAAMERVIAVGIALLTGALIIPSGKLLWNRLQAPARIANDQVVLLREQIGKYQAAEGIQVVRIDDHEINGRWYGRKFVLDNPKRQFDVEVREINEGERLFHVECPPHSLAHIEICMSDVSKVHFSKPGADSQIVEGNSASIEVTVDQNSKLEMWVEWGSGKLSVYLLAWTRAGG